jgi:hypothetical protein
MENKGEQVGYFISIDPRAVDLRRSQKGRG